MIARSGGGPENREVRGALTPNYRVHDVSRCHPDELTIGARHKYAADKHQPIDSARLKRGAFQMALRETLCSELNLFPRIGSR